MFAAGSAAPTRATSRRAARPASAPEIVYTAILTRCVRCRRPREPSAFPPVASTCVPKRVWNSSTCASDSDDERDDHGPAEPSPTDSWTG